MTWFQWLRGGLAVVGAFLGGLLGGWDTLLCALIIFVVCDYITGVTAAIINKELSSYLSFVGILKKLFYFVLVIIANTIDTKLGLDLGICVRSGLIYGLVFTEGISLLENMVRMGIKVPPIVETALDLIHKKSESGNGMDKED